MYETFVNSIRGGFCCVNKRRVVCNNIDMGEKFDTSKKSSTFVMGDFNSLYAGCLVENMPYDGFEYMDDNNVREYENDPNKFLDVNTSEQAVKGMWITADFIVLDKLKW